MPTPPPPPPAPGTVLQWDRLKNSMETPNSNGWYLRNNQYTKNSDGPNGHYAYVAQGIHSSYPNSFRNSYLNSNPLERGAFGDGETIWRQPWFVCGIGSGGDRNVNVATNVRLQIRGYRQYLLNKNGSWELGGSTENSLSQGRFSWHFTYSSPSGGELYIDSVPSDVRSEANNGGGESVDLPNQNIIRGGPPRGPASITGASVHGFQFHIGKRTTYANWKNYYGTVEWCEARLIKNVASGADEIDNADVVLYLGSDLYAPGWENEWGHGPLLLVTRNWQAFCHHDLLPAQLVATNKPPGWV